MNEQTADEPQGYAEVARVLSRLQDEILKAAYDLLSGFHVIFVDGSAWYVGMSSGDSLTLTLRKEALGPAAAMSALIEANVRLLDDGS